MVSAVLSTESDTLRLDHDGVLNDQGGLRLVRVCCGASEPYTQFGDVVNGQVQWDVMEAREVPKQTAEAEQSAARTAAAHAKLDARVAAAVAADNLPALELLLKDRHGATPRDVELRRTLQELRDTHAARKARPAKRSRR